ncbi:MAG: C4-type zinc ribbon domain-containing protein [Thermodesulfovibrionales bacterium]|nr:C4-type zinc ribbon domain-containing protein [Thermodesulfovibrionales bacterium]
MHPVLELLIKLQEIDKEIIKTTNEIDEIPKKISLFQKPVKDAQDALNQEKAKYQSLEKKKKAQEMDIEESLDKLNKLKSKTADIKSNKEYQAFLKEIETAENNIRKKENELLDLMEILEDVKKVVNEKEKAFLEEDKRLKEQQKILDKEIEDKKIRLKELKQQRAAFIKNIDEDIYKDYMHLLKISGGIAVAETKKEVCYGCNLHIPPQLYVEIMKGNEILRCPHCRRILFSREEPNFENIRIKETTDNLQESDD